MEEETEINNNDLNNNTDFEEEALAADHMADMADMNPNAMMENLQNTLLREARQVRERIGYRVTIDQIYHFLEVAVDRENRVQVVVEDLKERINRGEFPEEMDQSTNTLPNQNIDSPVIELNDSLSFVPEDESDDQEDDDDVVRVRANKRKGEQGNFRQNEDAILEQQLELIEDAVIEVHHEQADMNKVDYDLQQLAQLFPTKSLDEMREMYLSIVNIEKENTLNILAQQMYDAEDMATPNKRPRLESDAPATEAGPSRDPSSPQPGPSRETEFEEEVEEPEDDAQVNERMVILTGMFPDADPEYLRHKILETKSDSDAFHRFIDDAMDNKNYPKREEYEKRMAQENAIKTFTGRLNVEQFLKHFPNPKDHFESKTNGDSDLVYQQHCITFLKVRFPRVHAKTINEIFKKTYNLTKAVAALEKETPKMVSRRSTYENVQPERQHLYFLQEVTYIKLKSDFEDHFKSIEVARKQAFELAKERNELLECPVCCENECLFEDMTSCAEGHLFCKNCVKQYAETGIGDGKNQFQCLDDNCESEFPLQVLKSVLEAKVFACLARRLQSEEIKAAMIPDLETCPFCPYSYIPDENSLVFECQEETCKKVSCRKCQEPNHLPLKCEEVEKDDELRARQAIEERMTQALIRECPKCHNKFVKTDGCNKMTCKCGTKICYICRIPIKDYNHFHQGPPGTNPRKLCPLYSNNDELHVDIVMAEGAKAKEELAQKGVTLKHDPTAVAPVATGGGGAPAAGFHGYMQNFGDLFAHRELYRDNHVARQLIGRIYEYNARRRRDRQLMAIRNAAQRCQLQQDARDQAVANPPPQEQNRPRLDIPPADENLRRQRAVLHRAINLLGNDDSNKAREARVLIRQVQDHMENRAARNPRQDPAPPQNPAPAPAANNRLPQEVEGVLDVLFRDMHNMGGQRVAHRQNIEVVREPRIEDGRRQGPNDNDGLLLVVGPPAQPLGNNPNQPAPQNVYRMQRTFYHQMHPYYPQQQVLRRPNLDVNLDQLRLRYQHPQRGTPPAPNVPQAPANPAEGGAAAAQRRLIENITNQVMRTQRRDQQLIDTLMKRHQAMAPDQGNQPAAQQQQPPQQRRTVQQDNGMRVLWLPPAAGGAPQNNPQAGAQPAPAAPGLTLQHHGGAIAALENKMHQSRIQTQDRIRAVLGGFNRMIDNLLQARKPDAQALDHYRRLYSGIKKLKCKLKNNAQFRDELNSLKKRLKRLTEENKTFKKYKKELKNNAGGAKNQQPKSPQAGPSKKPDDDNDANSSPASDDYVNNFQFDD